MNMLKEQERNDIVTTGTAKRLSRFLTIKKILTIIEKIKKRINICLTQ
jgi:hypothetical protein